MSTKKAVITSPTPPRTCWWPRRRPAWSTHVAVSIVGIDKANSGLYAGKLVQEDEVKHGGIP
jgi:hypothetical protein